MKVDALLSWSFGPCGTGAYQWMIAADVGVDRVGIAVARDGGLGYSFPAVVMSGVK